MNNANKSSLNVANTAEHYDLVAQSLHWIIVLLVVIQFAVGVRAHQLPVSLERLKLLARHKSIGITILILMLLRVLWRLYSPPPRLPADQRRWVAPAAHLSHFLLYALLLLMPLIGWMASSASNLTVSWFGWIALPNLIHPDHQIAQWLLLAHESTAWLLLAVIIVHTSAACWHQFVLKDNLLMRMLPFGHRESTEDNRQ